MNKVNNDFYDELGERWYEAKDDPIALLRAESRIKNPWVAARIREHFGARPPGAIRILDVGCGGGFLSNALAAEGFRVTGVDVSEESLAVARRHDASGSVSYECHDALALPHAPASFDVACAMDFLEHVEDPAAVVAACARVLRPGGMFFFHTFNRTPLSWLLAVKGLEWFVRNAPRHVHVYRLFVTPAELAGSCAAAGLDVREMVGLRPALLSTALVRLLATGVVPDDFRFVFTKSLQVGYAGWALRA